MRTNWENILVEVSLPEQAQRIEATFMLELNTQSAEEPQVSILPGKSHFEYALGVDYKVVSKVEELI